MLRARAHTDGLCDCGSEGECFHRGTAILISQKGGTGLGSELRAHKRNGVVTCGCCYGSECPACGASRVISGSSVILGLGGGFLPFSHSANRRLGLSMHRSSLIFTAFLGQLLGKCRLLIKASIFSPRSPHQPQWGFVANSS